jgi:hypothetical protein
VPQAIGDAIPSFFESKYNRKEGWTLRRELINFIIHPSGTGRSERRDLIIRRCFIRDLLPAFLTEVDDHPALLAVMIKGQRLHESETHRSPVAGPLGVHVLAPETVRAMIAVTPLLQRGNGCAAVFADEGFLAGDERHC